MVSFVRSVGLGPCFGDNRSDLIEALIPDERDPNRDVVDRFAVHRSARTSAIEEML
jgi:hypothetical protein